MNIINLPSPKGRNPNPYLLELRNIRRSRDWLFKVMLMLQISFRDLAAICGYVGDNDFAAFMKRTMLGYGKHRMLITNKNISDVKQEIENYLRKKHREELYKENMELDRRLQK